MATMFPQALGAAPQGPAQYVDPYEAQIAAMRARMQQPQAPMYTPEQVEQRRTQNDREYQLGLLGQLSGDEGLSNIGGQVFKQALAARQPKISERGVADPLTGQFNYDPEYLRQRDEQSLAGLEQKSAGARAAYDEQRTRAAEREEARMRHDETLTTLAGTRQSAAQDAREARKATTDFKLEDSMADDFRKETSKPQLVIQAHNGLKATAQRNDPASDIAFIYQYMKILDPTSVVREGEFATAQNAGGIDARIRNAYNQVMNGTRLNPQQKAQMLDAAGRLAGAADAEIKQTAKNYQTTAARRGLNLDSVTPGYAPVAAAPPAVVDVGAMLGRGGAAPAQRNPMGAPRQALPKANPQQPAANRQVDAGW
jgi:hypothetical protein